MASRLAAEPAQRDARGLYLRLLRREAVYDDPRQQRLRQQIAEAHLQGDVERAESLGKRLRRQAADRAERIEELQKEAVAAADLELIRLFRQKPAFEPIEDDGGEDQNDADGQRAACREGEEQPRHFRRNTRPGAERSAARRQLPMEGDRVAAGAARYSSIGGSVARTGLIVQIDSTSFARPVDGPAALVRWLSGKKCADLKYELAGEF